MYLYETIWEPSFIHSSKLSSPNCCSSSQKITQQSNVQDYHEKNPTSCRTGLVPVDLASKSCIVKESKEFTPCEPPPKHKHWSNSVTIGNGALWAQNLIIYGTLVAIAAGACGVRPPEDRELLTRDWHLTEAYVFITLIIYPPQTLRELMNL